MIYINTVNYSKKIKAHWKVNRKVKKSKVCLQKAVIPMCEKKTE
mgnify:CR=1 FL=1